MENKNGRLRGKAEKNQLNTEQIKVAEVIYGIRALADCMEAVIKLRMAK